MSAWRWRAQYRDPAGALVSCPVRDDAQVAYRDADSAFERGASHVAIILYTPEGSGGLADSRDVERGGQWVVGLNRWRENERVAIAEGRA